jgi:two-component system sensor histidine kinase DesK
MRIDDVSKGRPLLPRELLFGRLVMIGFVAILLIRELLSLSVLSGSARITVCISTALLVLTWTWFWGFVAAGSKHIAPGVAVGLTLGTAVVLVEVNHIGAFPFYYAAVVAGTAYVWYISAGLVAVVTATTMAVWWPEGQTNATALQVFAITVLLGGGAIAVRRFVAAQFELNATREELRAFAALEARMALARDLHDRLGQHLTTSIMQAELLSMDLEADDLDQARPRAAMLLSTSRETLKLMREMVVEVREPELRSEVIVAERVLESSGISCTVTIDSERLPTAADRALGWVLREGVTNVLRHSGASSCRITVVTEQGVGTLRVEDNGEGLGEGAGGMGLIHMQERLADVGGTIALTADSDGGCTLLATVPLSP